MIYLIIGPSCAGKTSFIANTFIKNQQLELKRDITTYSECPSCYLIGNWLATKRSKGTDMVCRKEITSIVPQVEKLIPMGKDIILDGDKICSYNLFNQLLKYPCKLIYIRCSLRTSLNRNKANNSTNNPRTLKACSSKANNVYMQYCDIMDGEVIDTDNIKDFTAFSWETYKGQKVRTQKKLF